MIAVFRKEFNGFLNTLIAYMVIGVFLTATGLLMWVFPDTAVLDSEYAGMDTLFSLAPYVFIFLIPAITMRSFAEERKMGTLELLLTKPLTDWQIILGKFFASLALVGFSLLPTLLYYYSVYQLGNPAGNLDTSGVAGSYIGLFLLASIFCAAGILASSLTSNQIVAFVIGSFLCFFLYTGFQSISTLPFLSSVAVTVQDLGILSHYESISKGLIDSRDVIYFVTICAALLLVSKTFLGSRSW
jgi:ABC-2 type transport system permease protein